MSLCTCILLSLAIVQFVAPTSAVPSFDINLDAPAQKRWEKVALHYKDHLVGMAKALKPQMVVRAPWAWSKTVKYSPQIEAEMQGMVDSINDPEVTLDFLKDMNMLYEMESPTACSGVLWALPNGTVMQGRNMDYALHFNMPDGRVMNWPDVTFHAIFHKGGQPLFESTQWPGVMGVHTGMRFGGWGFQQNTRSGKNDWEKNFAAAKKGGKPFMSFAREVMETTPDFKTAVKTLYNAKFIAPMYFIMSGVGPFEGAVLTIDRLGQHAPDTPPIQYVDASAETSWHLLQTNDDLEHPPKDFRRPIANLLLGHMKQENSTVDHLFQFMHSPPLFHPGTVFTTVMVPATGYFRTILPQDSPQPHLTVSLGHDTGLFTGKGPDSAAIHARLNLLMPLLLLLSGCCL
jgi:hypothetical protein